MTLTGIKFSGKKRDSRFEGEVLRIHTECLKVIEQKYPETLEAIENLSVELNTRFATRAGSAQTNLVTKKVEIKLNYRLLSENFEEIKNTYRHELAHIVASLKYNANCGHDYRWKSIAISLGDTGERCHKMNVAKFRKPARKEKWECGCQSWEFSVRISNHMKKYVLSFGPGYKCWSCQKPLVHESIAHFVKAWLEGRQKVLTEKVASIAA